MPLFFHCIRIYDRDQDGVLSEAEREAVTVLNVSGKGITSLAGIEQFPRLEELYCYDNALTNLDVSANPQLRILDCTNNQISQLNLSENPGIIQLYCRENPLGEITLAAASDLTALEYDAGVTVVWGTPGSEEDGENRATRRNRKTMAVKQAIHKKVRERKPSRRAFPPVRRTAVMLHLP